MKKDFIHTRPSGSKKNKPKVINEVLNEYLHSNEPLAVALLNWKAKNDASEAKGETDRLFRDLFPDTHLDVDLKLITRQKGRMPVGAYLYGTITRDGDSHFSFVENDGERKRMVAKPRNPHVYVGKYINVIRWSDGTLYTTFNHPHYTEDFTFQDFCREAAKELLAVGCLVEKTDKSHVRK